MISKFLLRSVIIFLSFIACSCMKWEYGDAQDGIETASEGLFILCEGNFQYGNASLSFYDPQTDSVQNNLFYKANGMKLGDVAQSMTIHDDKAWIVINNSHVIFAIDPSTCRERGRIEGFTSPRYIQFISDDKAYVSQLWDNRIFIVNPSKYEITGYIEVPGMMMGSGSTEQMVMKDGYVYCSCWSYQNRILKIDIEHDEVVAQLEVGVQPASLAIDSEGFLWTMTDGGYEGSPYGFEPPSLVRIRLSDFTIDKKFSFTLGDSPRNLMTSPDGDELYWIIEGVWRMKIDSDLLPSKPFLQSRDTKYYGMTIDPATGEIYVADAIDYQQSGMIYRYTPDGELIDEFYVGVTPNAFCWK